MRKLLALGFLTSLTVLSAVVVMPAGAKPHGTNGLIAFTRFNAALGDTQLYTVNPDGSSEHQVLADPYQCPRWSPDGTRIAGCGTPDFGATRIVNPDDGTYRDLPWPDPELFSGCGTWSPDGKRLACESFGTTDPTRNGIYTMRSSDGGYLKRVTSNPGGDDLTGDYSPDRRGRQPSRTVRGQRQRHWPEADHDGARQLRRRLVVEGKRDRLRTTRHAGCA
jgi:Tol biopolymer transport system component